MNICLRSKPRNIDYPREKQPPRKRKEQGTYKHDYPQALPPQYVVWYPHKFGSYSLDAEEGKDVITLKPHHAKLTYEERERMCKLRGENKPNYFKEHNYVSPSAEFTLRRPSEMCHYDIINSNFIKTSLIEHSRRHHVCSKVHYQWINNDNQWDHYDHKPMLTK